MAKAKKKEKSKPAKKAATKAKPKAKAKPVVAKPKAAKASPAPKPGRRKAKAPMRSTPNRLVSRRRGGGSEDDLQASFQEEKPMVRKLKRGKLSKSELTRIKKDLIEQRQRIIDAMRRSQGVELVGSDVGDEADQAGLNVERELQFELSDNERTTLDQIEGALRKMEKGTFGLCEQCRLEVELLRIKALPFARYCIQCQNTSEKATATLL